MDNLTPRISRDDWNHKAHDLWNAGRRKEAIELMSVSMQQYGDVKPKTMLLQICFYLFAVKDYTTCVRFFKNGLLLYPDDPELLSNLAACCSRLQDYAQALHYATVCIQFRPHDFRLLDIITISHYFLGSQHQAREQGIRALNLKDKLNGQPPLHWSLPDHSAAKIAGNKKNVIAFSLWGSEPKYIYGALRNLLLAPDIYPDWELWFYVDDSVPSAYINLMKHLGAIIIKQPIQQSMKEKLCWRFHVASHSDVGYFLVRDADSVISIREQNAVQQWLESGRFFHIIRDWWTHTDLILAGLWGGVAGVLPDIQTLINRYKPDHVETASVDQCFLREVIWKYVKNHCLIHDRCFNQGNSIPLPGTLPAGNVHVGCCEAIVLPERQEKMLTPWLQMFR